MKVAYITAKLLPNDSKFKRENTIQRADLFKEPGESVGGTEWSEVQNVQRHVYSSNTSKLLFV